jgi:hypothetical protein
MLARAPAYATILLACLGSCNVEDPTAASQRNLIEVNVVEDAIPGDGFSRSEVFATLRGDTRDTVTVTFRTEAGSFVTAAGTSTNEVAMLATENSALAILKSDPLAGDVIVRASARGFDSLDHVTFTRVSPDRLRLSTSRSSARADGASIVTVTAQLLLENPEQTVTQGTRVVFTAVDTVTLQPVSELRREGESDDAGKVVVDLVSATVVDVWIRAEVLDASGIQDSTVVRFVTP